ncbi:hypothetical protein JG688_00007632 [Phytophthora aleatoria]|uniref:Vacuolar protein sorting-associated protein n=1 Tax=Phytophthora aleatoria TaxID=2496075 RepID=A0A8J5IS34_9STRA|nr:hypothetical protein JG688_00007632 [Phytophthora aleatoria]
MFETLVTGLLTSALGSYIEPKCFSSDKINVAVWSGYVVLTELEVKPEVVAELPAVKLVRGLVGSIELKIPWNRLQSDSVVATVDDVYLLLRTEEDIDAVMRQMDEFTLKKKLLEELYAQAKRQEQTADGSDTDRSEDGFAARLVNKIIDNLELHIRRIHIRVEDHSSGEHPFALGLTIESVHVQSTNSNWQPSYIDTSKSNEPRIFKIVELNHLSVYCNPDCELQRDHKIDFETCSAEEFSSAFSRSIPKRFDDRHYHHMQLYPSHQQHHFILKPIDASARLIVNRDVFDANVPKFEVDVNVSEVAFRLEESQYCDMLYLASALQIPDHYTKYQRYRKFRPRAAVVDEPAEWWKYAVTSVMEDLKTKKQLWTWGFMKDRREDRKRYVSLWQQRSRQLLELTDVDYVLSDSEDNDDDGDESGVTMEDDDQGRTSRVHDDDAGSSGMNYPSAPLPPYLANIYEEEEEYELVERFNINVTVRIEETPLELSVRTKGFDWSEPLELVEDLGDVVRIKMKDLVSDAHLYITAEIRMSKGHCRELFLYVPYWIVNLTGLKLEYEYEEERMGREHSTALLAGQKRLDRDELLLKEYQRAKAARRDRNPHLLCPVPSEDDEFTDGMGNLAQQSIASGRSASPDRRESERKRRHPRLLPSVPPVKGLLDLLPKSIEYDPRSLGQLEVLQACHSDYTMDRGCVRLRVSNERDVGALDARKESGQRKWSDPFVLDQAGTIGEIEADDFGANKKFSIGYSIIPAKGQYSRTKVIMLTPRFMLINTMSSAVEVCHSSSKMMTPSVIGMANSSGTMPNSRVMSPVNPVVQLDAGAFADFHWTLRFAKTRTIRCRFAEHGWSWSGAVPLAESGEYAVRMRHESTRESKLVRVTLKLDSSCVCVYFREERTTAPPYRVENYSLETLRTHQHRVRRSEILLPHHSLDYAWDEPTEERLLVVDMLPSAAGDNSRPLRIGSFDLDKIQRYPDALGGTLGIEISTDGPTRVLRFTDTRLRGEKAVPASTHDQPAKTEASEGSALQLLQRFVTAPTVQAALHLQGVGISIVDSVPKELVYMSVSGIALDVLVSEVDRNNSGASIAGSSASLSRLERETRPRILACCLEVNDIQVDNQLQVTPYPVLLRFSNPSGRSRVVNGQTISIPVLQVGLVKHEEYAGIEFIRHFSVSVLPVHVRVDGALLYQILPLLVHAKIYGSSGNADAATNKRAVVLMNGVSSNDETTRAAHSHLLLSDFNSSLDIPVKVLEAAQKGGTTSAGPTSGPTTPTMKMVTRRNSARHQQQLISPRQNQHTALAAEIQRYTTAKYGSLGAIAAKDEQKKLYFEEFHIDPIRATVSFSFGDSAGAIVDGHSSSLSHAAALTDSSREPAVITVGPLRLILNAIGTSLTKIANAPFQLKALHIHNSFVQPDALATRLASHYQSEALRQAYVILGSVDVLGNPMIAWKNLRSGFQDFISEPAHGLSQRSPQAFAFGVGRGSLSLVRASVYTFLDFNTRILTAFSLGLSEACLKLDDYTGYPATRHIFQGLVQGVSGVVVAPIHSFEVNGARGVFPGLMAGAFGLVLKPLLGFSLATATTAATLRDAIDPNTKALLVRVRPPRHIDLRTKRLKVYSYVESLGEEIVGKIRGGRYRADGYLGHVDLKATHQCFLVTRKRILFLNVKGAASAQTTKYDVEWELLAEEVVMVDCSRTPDEQIVTIYYMEDEFRTASGAGRSAGAANGSNAVTTSRRRTPGIPRGMFLQKHEVALPDTKVLFVRAMLQQQERSLLTKMNSYTKDGTPHHVGSVSSVARSNSMELSTAWQPQHSYLPLEYPIFRLPPSLHQTRSFASLAQTPPSHAHNNHK